MLMSASAEGPETLAIEIATTAANANTPKNRRLMLNIDRPMYRDPVLLHPATITVNDSDCSRFSTFAGYLVYGGIDTPQDQFRELKLRYRTAPVRRSELRQHCASRHQANSGCFLLS